jgi:hypothetical protein
VYRLREALPRRELYRTLLMSAHTHVRGDPEYPTYEWCKRVVTNFLHDKTGNKLNEEEDERGTSLSLRQNPRGGKFVRTGGRQNERVIYQKSQNAAPGDRRPNLPLP